MSIVITLFLILAIVLVIFWIVDRMGIPGPLAMLVKGLAGLVAIIYLFSLLTSATGVALPF